MTQSNFADGFCGVYRNMKELKKSLMAVPLNVFFIGAFNKLYSLSFFWSYFSNIQILWLSLISNSNAFDSCGFEFFIWIFVNQTFKLYNVLSSTNSTLFSTRSTQMKVEQHFGYGLEKSRSHFLQLGSSILNVPHLKDEK